MTVTVNVTFTFNPADALILSNLGSLNRILRESVRIAEVYELKIQEEEPDEAEAALNHTEEMLSLIPAFDHIHTVIRQQLWNEINFKPKTPIVTPQFLVRMFPDSRFEVEHFKGEWRYIYYDNYQNPLKRIWKELKEAIPDLLMRASVEVGGEPFWEAGVDHIYIKQPQVFTEEEVIAQTILRAMQERENSFVEGIYTLPPEQAIADAIEAFPSAEPYQDIITVLLQTAWNDAEAWAMEVLNA